MSDRSTTTDVTRTVLESGVATVYLDVPGRKMNVLDVPVLEALTEAVVRAAERSDVRAIVLTSGKESGFCAGADVERIGSCRARDEGTRLATLGQRCYARIERLNVPVVACVRGPCLGGGLELALATHGLIASDEPSTRLGLPEVRLGIVPGFGGTQRLPRRIGIVRALDLILSGRLVKAKSAFRMGLADDVACPFAVLDEARRYARELADGKPRRNEKRRTGWKWWLAHRAPARAFILRKARDSVMARTRGVYPAPLMAIDLVGLAFGTDRAAGYEAEAAAVGELLVRDETHHLIELFLRMEELKKSAGDVPGIANGDRVGVVGAGVMGADIAHLLIQKGATVRLFDVDVEALRRGVARIAGDVERAVRRGRLSRNEADRSLDRLEPALAIGGLSTARAAIEAVVERTEVKEVVFRELERALAGDALLLTNTSSLPISDLARSVERPERLVGLHFFNPVALMPLVEVVVGAASAADAVVRTVAFARDLGKVPVRVKDSPGFLVNRILAPYLSEALQLLEDGVEPKAIDDSMRRLGFPMGPLRVLDTVGLDVAGHVAESLRAFLGARLGDPRVGRLLVEAGHLGEKSGGGIYVRKRTKALAAPWLAETLDRARAERAAGVRTVSLQDVEDRLLFAFLAESARAHEERIVESSRDLDAAMVLGSGFPAQLGGPLREIDRRGAATICSRLDELAVLHGPRFGVGDDLRERARSGRLFHDGSG